MQTEEFKNKCQIVKDMANGLFNQVPKPSGMCFFNEILSINGAIRQQFAGTELKEFYATDDYKALLQFQSKLNEIDRAQGRDENGSGREAMQVITVRMPQSLHSTLKEEAYENHTSMNKLCIQKLMMPAGSS